MPDFLLFPRPNKSAGTLTEVKPITAFPAGGFPKIQNPTDGSHGFALFLGLMPVCDEFGRVCVGWHCFRGMYDNDPFEAHVAWKGNQAYLSTLPEDLNEM